MHTFESLKTLIEQPTYPIIEPVNDPHLEGYSVQLDIRRDDLIADGLSGNKLHKLRGFLFNYLKDYKGQVPVLSFGGPWSNHLYALITLNRDFGLPIEVVIRGERPKEPNTNLLYLEQNAKAVHYISRSEYREYRAMDYVALCQNWPDRFVIPEGGSGRLGCRGVFESMGSEVAKYDRIVVAVGTGTTMAAIAQANPKNLTGIMAVNDESGIRQTILGANNTTDWSLNWQLIEAYPENTYGRAPEFIIQFIADVFSRTKGQLCLDPVYTGKAMYALYQLLEDGAYQHERILFIHTGGLQGLRGYPHPALEPLKQLLFE